MGIGWYRHFGVHVFLFWIIVLLSPLTIIRKHSYQNRLRLTLQGNIDYGPVSLSSRLDVHARPELLPRGESGLPCPGWGVTLGWKGGSPCLGEGEGQFTLSNRRGRSSCPGWRVTFTGEGGEVVHPVWGKGISSCPGWGGGMGQPVRGRGGGE